MICNDAVYLLGHLPVKTPETCLHVPDRNVKFDCCKSPREHGVGISLHEDYIWPLFIEYPLRPGQDLPGLLPVKSRTHIKAEARFREFQFFKEDPVHLI